MLLSSLARRPKFLVAALFLISSGLQNVAWSNGDEFFRADAFSDDKPLHTQVIYSGTVKDQDDNYIEGATITVAIVVNTPRGEQRIAFNAYTNEIGRYRTLDVASVVLVMEEVEVKVDPDLVEFTIEKPGYELDRRLDRSKARQSSGVFEVDFWLRAQSN